MPGEFARSCIDMTGRLYAELLWGGEGASALLPTVYQLQCRTSEKTTLPNEGDRKELAAWIKHVVASYEPRAYLRRVTCEGDGFCVVVSNPVLRLTHDSFLGAGRASILASYLWTGTADQPRLRSAHLSLLGVIADLGEGEAMTIIGSERVGALRMVGGQSTDSHPAPPPAGQDGMEPMLMLRGDDGGMHYFNPMQVVYIQADRNYVQIHGETKTIRVRGSLAETLEKMPPYIVKVHRSYAVNALRVREVRDGQVLLATGESLPVPTRKRAEVRKTIHEAQRKARS